MNEITTEKKKSSHLVTEQEDLEQLNKIKLESINKENLTEIFEKIGKENINSISKINQVSKESKILKVELISSCFEPTGLILKITPFGYEKSLRKDKDGITYFGYEEQYDNKVNIFLIILQPTIDYIIRPKEEKIDDRFIGKHFQIKFNPDDKQYYLRDLGRGFGTFIKIIGWVEIKNNFLLSIGENYIVFNIGIDEDMLISEKDDKEYNENMISLKIFSGNIKHGNFCFGPEQSPFIIGRSPEADVIIDDSLLSRFHCTIKYSEDKWYIIDGIYDKNLNGMKNSTNGSWKYALEDNLIVEGMTFKANHNLFICSFSKD